MTTICSNRKMMASDSMCIHGERKSYGKKLQQTSGKIAGVAGDYADGLVFMEWLRGGGKGKAPKGDYEALVLSDDGLMLYDSGKPSPITEEFYAIGTGSDGALGAMHCGCTPKQAVSIAIKIDVYSGGRVQVKRLYE